MATEYTGEVVPLAKEYTGEVIPLAADGSPGKPAPSGLDKAVSISESIGKGIMDPITGIAKVVQHALPDHVVEAVNHANNLLAKYDPTGGRIIGVIPEGPHGVASLVTGSKPRTAADDFTDAQKADDTRVNRDREEAGRGNGEDWYRLAGNFVTPLPGGAEAKGLSLAKATGQAALKGGALGLASNSEQAPDESFAERKAKDVALGVLTGGAVRGGVGAATNVAGKVVAPTAREAAKYLADKGVTLTPGQILGGWAQRAEESLSSVPFLGSAIRGAQKRSVESFSLATVNDALDKVGEKLPDGLTGQEALKHARKTLSAKYDDVLGSMRGDLDHRPTPRSGPGTAVAIPGQPGGTGLSFRDELENIRKLGNDTTDHTGMDEPERKKLNHLIDNIVIPRFNKYGLTSGDTLKNLDRILDEEAGKALSGSAPKTQLGGAIKEIDAAMKRMIYNVNPDKAEDLANTDAAWALFKRSQRAGSSVGAMSNEGFFTPAQYLNAAKALDKTVGKRAASEGDALGQKMAEAGKDVIGLKVPDSGTPERAMTAMAGKAGLEALAGGGALAAGHSALPALLAGYGATQAAYSRPGTDLFQRYMMGGSASLANQFRKAAPGAAGIALPGAVAATTGSGQ
jgi:hypothetical protein